MKEAKKQPWETAEYTNNPELPALEHLEIVTDFLPRPEELVFRPKGKKVTITLSDESIAYFKTQADKLGTSYQRMIRNLIDEYVRQMQRADRNLARKS
ncbi:MAG: hypothetical protein KJZ93_25180 [Caldilineaceae bacterium]|nr:hypothetical protein [Caldilineaceae bacterium]